MNNTLSKYIEKIRISRNLTREKFVQGILSERQYRRYLKGESSMPNEKVNQLVTKLGLDLFEFYLDFFEESEIQTSKLKDIFNSIRTGKLKSAHDKMKTINVDDLDSPYQKQYYNFCRIYLNILTERTQKSIGYDEILKLIDYPNITNKKVINFIELVALETVSRFLQKNRDDDRGINFLSNLLSSDEFELKGINFMVLPSIYANVSKTLLIQGLYDKAIVLIDKGIGICKKYEIYNSLSHLLYYKAYYYKKIDEIDKMNNVITQLEALLLVENNAQKSDYYHNNIKKNLK